MYQISTFKQLKSKSKFTNELPRRYQTLDILTLAYKHRYTFPINIINLEYIFLLFIHLKLTNFTSYIFFSMRL